MQRRGMNDLAFDDEDDQQDHGGVQYYQKPNYMSEDYMAQKNGAAYGKAS